MLRVIHLLSPHAAGAERNWSIEEFIFSRRRNRLDGHRGTQLVYIYWNLRMLERAFVHSADMVDTWRASCCTARVGFPHPKLAWEPFSNWGSSSLGSFEGMHGDEIRAHDDADAEGDDEDEEDIAVDDQPVRDWDIPAHEALRPCPPGDQPARSVVTGDRIVCWFQAPFNDWFIGEVIPKVDMRKTMPVRAQFEDGPADLYLDRNLYGVTNGRDWALLQPLAAGPSGVTAVPDLANGADGGEEDDSESGDSVSDDDNDSGADGE